MGSTQSQVKCNTNRGDSSSTSSDCDWEEDSDEYVSLDSDMGTVDDDSCAALTADAAYTVSRQILSNPTNDDINLLDSSLDQYEKISMIYLLYDDPNTAYDVLQSPLKTTIRYWFQQARSIEKWNWKLLEALCIIKNYKVLRIMGHKKADMIQTFLPNNDFVRLYVNVVRKALFCTFENLTEGDIDRLIFALQKDLTSKSIPCYVNRDNLELTFLHLEKVNYISLRDLKNVCQLFKSIDMLTEYEHLKALHDKVNSSSREQSGAANWIPTTCSSLSNDTNEPHSSQNIRHIDYFMRQNLRPLNANDKVTNASYKFVPDTDDCYQIDTSKPGLLLIINNEHFYSEGRKEFKGLRPQLPYKLSDRAGTEVDKNDLQKVFQKLKYEVVVSNDRTHDTIKDTIKNCIKRFENERFSSLFVAILSHGDKGVIYGCNSIPVEIEEIQKTLYSPLLRGIPKVLLIQACQGEKLQEIDEYTTDGNDAGASTLTPPSTADMLVFYATIPNYSAIRHPSKGTWFIQALCEKIADSNNDHFEEICLKIKQLVANKRWGKVVMVPLTASTLTKKLYLTPRLTNVNFPMENAC